MEDRPTLPTTVAEAAEALRGAQVPRDVLSVAHRLAEAGHAGVLVGGAVRDFLLGVEHDDWDLATSATPEEVVALFKRTIPTGMQHGTVTVMVGRGEERQGVEVTTFRGEGAYVDGRRPSEVRFLRELEDDLARRDFTVNAFAWDPVAETFTDSFGGLEDLRAGLVRAVGEPLARFREDGLRTMRGVRFCATLGFALESATETAIPNALDVFDRVSRERVRVELFKLLGARRPSLGLEPMVRTGLWGRVLGEVEPTPSLLDAVDAAPADPVSRLARIQWPVRGDRGQIEGVLEGLKPSREERSRVLAATSTHVEALGDGETPPAIRRAVAGLGPKYLKDALTVLDADASFRARVGEACEGAALSGRDLAIKGGELIKAGLIKPGPALGDLLDAMLDRVLDEPALNDRERLLELARELIPDVVGVPPGAQTSSS